SLLQLCLSRALPAQDMPNADTAFIRVALAHIYETRRPGRIVVLERVLALPPVRPPKLPSCDSLELWRAISPIKPHCGQTVLDSIPPDLTVGAVPQLWGKTEWVQAEIPNDISVVADAKIRSLFGGTDLRASWRDYYTNYPETRGFDSFSHALITVDGLQAL